MDSDKNRIIYYNPDKGWADKRNSASQPDKYYDTQNEAYEASKEHLKKQGGGEISIKRKDNGKIRDKHTISPAKDPFPPKG